MIRIPESIYHSIVEHAKKEAPLECCGILSGRNETVEKVFELRNEEQSPVRYSMSPQEQLKVFDEMDRQSLDMLAIYHSHTHTVPYPSETDLRLAFYPEVVSVIISLKEETPVMKAFRIQENAISTEEIEII
ncbi:MAG: M67 family metallopeptidase [Deltaproteobacteria bacterium]|nr:M67 family metallopeptidase [Deltaproteobacteria bacterium]MBM4322506.1 M67 family metallopeptidase [Deltaproteobacteria bacterium]